MSQTVMYKIYERAYWISHQRWDANFYDNKKEAARYSKIKSWIVNRLHKTNQANKLLDAMRSLD